jgi:hypothetical protein
MAGVILVSCTNATGGTMLSPRFLRLYADKCRRSAQSMDDRTSVAEFEAMALDLEDWANDPAGRTIHALSPHCMPRPRADFRPLTGAAGCPDPSTITMA